MTCRVYNLKKMCLELLDVGFNIEFNYVIKIEKQFKRTFINIKSK